jgi:Tol biopolymer transport system component
VGSLDTTEAWDLGPIGASAVYAEPGFLLFRREGALVAQPFDLASRQLRGSPMPIVDDVGYNVISYQGLFSASSNGVLVFQDSKPGSQLTWFDRDGRRLGPATPPGDQNNFCLMADESRIVYEMADVTSGNVDLWMVDAADRQPTRLTFHSDIDFYPQCAPAGDDIVFASLRDGPPNIWRLPVGSPGSESVILQSPGAKIPSDWSRADLVFFGVLNRETFWDIHVLSLADGSTHPVVETRAEERNAQISRDGRWLAYVSNESGTFEVYVQPFPLTSARWQVSQGGGMLPQWAGSGREIYYMAPDTSLISRSVTVTVAGLTLGEPRVLMRTNVTGWEAANQSSQYRVTSDGRRVLVNTVTDAVRSISVVLNWTTASER